jgi:GNAT superfamily N-acetyltransferase
MTFDAALALRMITNDRLRTAQGCDFRDIGGALALTSDAPIPDLNCIRDFAVDESALNSLLDLGFALLRAFDRDPAAELTPLDRPPTIAEHLQQRGLRRTGGRSRLAFRDTPASIVANDAVEVRVAEPEDARTFASLHGGSESWVKRMSLATVPAAMLDPGNTFYLGYVDGQAVATLHLLRDGATAGIYAVGTMKMHRRHGVSTTLIARAVRDAYARGCDVVCLSTAAAGYAETLYTKLGFERIFESQLWTTPERT